MEGTKIDGGEVELEAGELDYKAARNTRTKKSTSSETGVSASAGVGLGTNAVEGSVGVKNKGGKEEESSSTAVVGGITSAGGLKIKTTKGDARLEGTKINSGGDAEIDAAGDFKFDAATSTSSKKKSSHNLKVNVGYEGSVDASGKGGHSNKEAETVKQEGGSLNVGGNLKVKSGKDMTLVGTNIDAKKDAELDAGGNFDYKAAKETSKSSSEKSKAGFSLKVSEEGSDDGDSFGASVDYGEKSKQGEKAKTGVIKSGGNLKVKSGNDATVENTGKTVLKNGTIEADGSVKSKSVKDTSKSDSLSVTASLSAESGEEGGGSGSFGISMGDDEASEKSVKAEASVAVKTNTQSAQAEKLIKTPAFTKETMSGKKVDMEGWSAEVKTELAKKVIAEAMGVDPSKVDAKNPSFVELNKKLKEAKSINGSGPNSFDLKGFCKTLKTD
jgi:hypothetical protein